MENTTPTKDQVHQVFKTSKNGAEIAKAVCDYFKANFKRVTPAITQTNDDIIEVAQNIFGSVETPGPVTASAATDPGFLTPPRTTQLGI